MLKMSDKSKEFLTKYLPETLEAEHVNDILDPLYDWIMVNGFEHVPEPFDHYNALGDEAQEVYDDLYDSNE